MIKDEEMILQINNLLNEFSSSTNNQKSDKLVYYNENTQLNEIILSKNNFITDIASQRIELINMDSFIKKTSVIINAKNTEGVNGKLAVLIPIFLVAFYFFMIFFITFYKKQSLKALQNKA
jgi:ATP-dependent Zn protease